MRRRSRTCLGEAHEQGVDVLHGQHCFGDHDIHQRGDLLPGVLLFDRVAQDAFFDIVAHHGRGELYPAKGAEAGGADAVSLINTLTGMKIDINRKTFALANKTGGVSGPIVKPIAVRMVYQVAQAVNIPIIGMGGISCAEDAIEFILAGASAVSVGTANFHNPAVTLDVIDGIEAYMKKNGFNSVKEMVGIVK